MDVELSQIASLLKNQGGARRRNSLQPLTPIRSDGHQCLSWSGSARVGSWPRLAGQARPDGGSDPPAKLTTYAHAAAPRRELLHPGPGAPRRATADYPADLTPLIINDAQLAAS